MVVKVKVRKSDDEGWSKCKCKLSGGKDKG